jgi:hypothetical protein
VNDHESGIELCEWAVGMYIIISKIVGNTGNLKIIFFKLIIKRYLMKYFGKL